jgi:hypothetical protein
MSTENVMMIIIIILIVLIVVYWLMNQRKSYVENFGACDFGTTGPGQVNCKKKAGCFVGISGNCAVACPSPDKCGTNKECKMVNGNCVPIKFFTY